MPGVHYRVCPRFLFDFSNVGASTYLETIAAKAVPIIAHREATLLVRVHTGTAFSAGNTVDVRVRMEAPSDDDPTIDFVYPTELATLSVSSSVALLFTPISFVSNQNLGSYLRIVVRGTQSGSPGTLK